MEIKMSFSLKSNNLNFIEKIYFLNIKALFSN
jgi:hypothetical protein